MFDSIWISFVSYRTGDEPITSTTSDVSASVDEAIASNTLTIDASESTQETIDSPDVRQLHSDENATLASSEISKETMGSVMCFRFKKIF